MQTHPAWPRVLSAIGLCLTLIGVVDPLEGSFAILAGIGLVALAAALGGSRWCKLLVSGFALVAVGIGAMVVLSVLGGIGGEGGLSKWWATLILPYPIGWLLGVTGAVLLTIELYRTVHKPAVTGSSSR
jgi:hypothetical protein